MPCVAVAQVGGAATSLAQIAQVSSVEQRPVSTERAV